MPDLAPQTRAERKFVSVGLIPPQPRMQVQQESWLWRILPKRLVEMQYLIESRSPTDEKDKYIS